MAKKTHSGEENDRKIPPAKARPKTIDSGDAVLDALAKLRGVRTPDKGKLGLREAIAVALEQGAAYERWKARGTPVRRVQIWVEGRRVTTVSSDDMSANLKSFHFDVASRRDAVMQILKADEGEEPVVLRNLPLGMVTAAGLDDPISLPNGQRIALKIAPTESGRFDVRIAFSVGEETTLPIKPPLARGATAKAAAAKKMSNDHWQNPPPPMWRPQPNAGAFASAFVILFLALVGIYSWTRLTAYKNCVSPSSVAVQTPEGKLGSPKPPSGTHVTSKVRKKGDRSQATGSATQTRTDQQEASQVAESKDASVPKESKEGGTGDTEVAVEQTMQSAINPISRSIGERVGAESRGIPPSGSHGQNKSIEPLNYSSPNGSSLDRRLRGVENSSRDSRTFSYSGRMGTGFFRRQQD